MFFKGIDWTQVYLQKYPPPLIPPKGEVNAADAFDIGSFDEEDTKGIKVVFVSDHCAHRIDLDLCHQMCFDLQERKNVTYLPGFHEESLLLISVRPYI